MDLERGINEAKHLIGMTRLRLKEYLREMQRVCLLDQNKSANVVSLLEVYKMFLQKEKVLYSTLNRLRNEERLFLGFCWIPRSDNEKVKTWIDQLKHKDSNIEIPTLKIV